MAEGIGKKCGAYLSGVTAAIDRKTSVWSEMNHLKEEAKRSYAQIELLELEIDNLKKNAGASAYELWKTGVLKADSLTELFEKVKALEADAARQRADAGALERQMELLREKRDKKQENARSEPTSAQTEQAATRPEPTSAQAEQAGAQPEQPAARADGGTEAADGAEPAYICPNCGARSKTAVNFCRKCGTRLNLPGGETK